MFHILNLDKKEPIADDEGETLTFETGAAAAEKVKELTRIFPSMRLQPRRISENVDWRARERAKFESSEYAPLPDYFAPLEINPDHFLHVSKDKPELLAYTKNESKGRANIQSRITLAGYLDTYHAGISRTIRAMVKEAHAATTLEPDGLKFATTPDEIERVYTNYDSTHHAVAGSCMRYDTGEFRTSLPFHPTRVYGAGDLAIAYLANEDDETITRALCWPEKKIYSRVYGDNDALHRALLARGYQKSAYYNRYENPTFAGAKLLRCDHDDYPCVFVMPYIDEEIRAHDEGEFLVLTTAGPICTRETNGWSQESSEYICERCEEGCDDTYEVYTRQSRTQSWCECCRNRHAFYCSYSESYYSDAVESVEMDNDETWSIYAFRDHGLICARTDTNIPADDAIQVIHNERGVTETWSKSAVDDYAWRCDRSREWISDALEPVEIDGELVSPHIASGLLTLTGDDPDQLALNLAA